LPPSIHPTYLPFAILSDIIITQLIRLSLRET
jgi:hypothetical protein